MHLYTPIEKISNIGPFYQKKLNKLGIQTVEDLLFHFPYKYDNFSNLVSISKVKEGERCSIKGKIIKIENSWQEEIETEAIEEKKTAHIIATQSVAGEEERKEENKIEASIEASKNDSLKIINKLVNFGFQKSSGRKIDAVIIHSSYDALGNDPYNVSGLINEYKQYGVAPHYLIDRKGQIYLLVEEKDIAYHAGVSEIPDGRNNVNTFSIGIEMINTKIDKYTDEQYESLKKLLVDIKNRYKIKYVLGHEDIAPGRKDDPWNFNWDKL